MPRRSQPALIEPSRQQLLERLERDIVWLKQHRLWSRSFFERAVRRYINDGRTTAGLEAFITRHATHAATSAERPQKTTRGLGL